MDLDPDLVEPDERQVAILAHLSVFVCGVVAPALLYVVRREHSPFIAYHTRQALMFQGLMLAWTLILVAPVSLGLASIACPCGPALALPVLLCIPAAISASRGRWSGYPLLASIGRPVGVLEGS